MALRLGLSLSIKPYSLHFLKNQFYFHFNYYCLFLVTIPPQVRKRYKMDMFEFRTLPLFPCVRIEKQLNWKQKELGNNKTKPKTAGNTKRLRREYCMPAIGSSLSLPPTTFVCFFISMELVLTGLLLSGFCLIFKICCMNLSRALN